MTTYIASILDGRYGMALEASGSFDEPWYGDWAVRNPKKISESITVGWYAYSSLLGVYDPEDIDTAYEYFGGMGAQSLIIQELFAPATHAVADYARESVTHMRRALPGHIDVDVADAYDGTSHPADLVGLDFGDLTVWKLRPGQPHRDLVDRVFAAEPRAVVVTDVASPRLHLHRDRYETMLGEGSCASYPSYLLALGEWFERTYGYVLVAGFYHRGAAKMAFAPAVEADRGGLHTVPPTPVGLEIL